MQDYLSKTGAAAIQILRWARQLAEAVAYIHTKGGIHNDNCVRNCFLDESLNLKFGDFQGHYTDKDGHLEKPAHMKR